MNKPSLPKKRHERLFATLVILNSNRREVSQIWSSLKLRYEYGFVDVGFWPIIAKEVCIASQASTGAYQGQLSSFS